MNSNSLYRIFAPALATALLSGCGGEGPEVIELHGADSHEHGLAAVEGGAEMAIDAPWRLEPTDLGGGQMEFGDIPINISIHDSDQITTPGMRVLEFLSVSVQEGDETPVEYDINDLHEWIEANKGRSTK